MTGVAAEEPQTYKTHTHTHKQTHRHTRENKVLQVALVAFIFTQCTNISNNSMYVFSHKSNSWIQLIPDQSS